MGSEGLVTDHLRQGAVTRECGWLFPGMRSYEIAGGNIRFYTAVKNQSQPDAEEYTDGRRTGGGGGPMGGEVVRWGSALSCRARGGRVA